jgi:hypothetical protein
VASSGFRPSQASRLANQESLQKSHNFGKDRQLLGAGVGQVKRKGQVQRMWMAVHPSLRW